MIYLDNGPIAKSRVFGTVMARLGIDVRTHMSKGSDGRRVTARSKGKVERPFRYRLRRRTKRSITSTRPKTRPRPTFGCGAIWSGYNSQPVERVTFHNAESDGFCVLRIKARRHRDLVTIVGM